MLNILDVLYNYIQENRIAYYLSGDLGYCLTGWRIGEMEEWLEASLPPETRARLERPTAARTERNFRYEQALSRYGLGLGLELTGSGRLPG